MNNERRLQILVVGCALLQVLGLGLVITDRVYPIVVALAGFAGVVNYLAIPRGPRRNVLEWLYAAAALCGVGLIIYAFGAG